MVHFSLRNLFVFVFACCLYLAALRGMGTFWYSGKLPGDSMVVATLIVSWFLLLIVYAFWHLKSSLAVHFFGPGVVTVIVIFMVAEGLPPDTTLGQLLLESLTIGCSISTSVSFPTTTLIILVRAFGSNNVDKSPRAEQIRIKSSRADTPSLTTYRSA